MITPSGVDRFACHRLEMRLGFLPDAEQCAVRKIYLTHGYVRAVAVLAYLKTHKPEERSVITLSKIVG